MSSNKSKLIIKWPNQRFPIKDVTNDPKSADCSWCSEPPTPAPASGQWWGIHQEVITITIWDDGNRRERYLMMPADDHNDSNNESSYGDCQCWLHHQDASEWMDLLLVLPPGWSHCCHLRQSTVTWLTSCVFHQVSHLHLDVTIASGERGVTAGVIWVHMNIGYTSRNPTPHCVISTHKNSRQIFSISPPSKYFTLKIFFRSPPHIPPDW